jgi:4-hydroxyphenylpyruvate dioxygenase
VNTYRHAWRIVADVDHPALGTCLDSFHILSRGDDPSGIREIPGEKIFFLQLADAPRLSMDVLSWSRHHRKFPGQGNFDLAGFGAHVQAAGYTGPWSLEIFNDTFRQAASGRTAQDAHRSLLYLQEEVGCVQESNSHAPVLFEPPSRGVLEGVVSLRAAAGPEMAGELDRALQHIGFELVGRHRDHDLQLWQHGALRFAVDATPDTVWTAPGVPAELPVLTQIGVRAAEPEQWGRRAEALEVPAHEVELPGAGHDEHSDVVRLKVTDATSIDLRSPGSAAAWRTAFTDSALTPPDAEPWLSGVDHVALTVPEGKWDGVLLLLRSVFGMHVDPGADVIDAAGLMHAQALSFTDNGSDTSLRIQLHAVPGSVEDVAPRPGGVSHVAFATSDIFGAAQRMRDAGCRPLPISPNYYEDLAARFDLGKEKLANMAEFGVLYDADTEGEFFHLFTDTVGTDLFFEVVQRVGGYRGYGDVNAAVRVEALRTRARTR